MKDITAIYPGSFDPVTLGHLDIIERASRLFSSVLVAVAEDSQSKRFTFSTQERVDFITKITRDVPNVKACSFTGLITAFARTRNATSLVRGLRAISDFEYEFQMASMNNRLAPEIETVFMMTHTRYSFLSSSVVKEIGRLGGDVSGLLPAEIHDDVIRKLIP